MSSTSEATRRNADTIDPARVPQQILCTGATMPAIGLGTFGSDHVSHQAVADAITFAAQIGYRHFDCASVYGNEDKIGLAFKKLFQGGLKREEVWITSKLWNDNHAERDVIASCEKSLLDLQLEYLDLYLVHWPFPNHHPPGCDVSARNPHAVPYIHESYMRTWRKMEELVDRGLVRHIGTSNMTIPKMKLLLRDARIKPAVNEMELHPHFQQPEFFRYLLESGICGNHAVLITGLGPVGLAAGALCRKLGAQQIIGIDIARERLELAMQRPRPCGRPGTMFPRFANLREESELSEPLIALPMRTHAQPQFAVRANGAKW
jgi:diketogulonate reductase-like aldo/keto reductase